VITSTTTGTVTDVSDANFSIFTPVVTVTAPNGSENWQAGTTQSITWSSSNVTNVKIELFKAGIFDTELTPSTTSDGSFNWNILASRPAASDYRIVITDASDGTVADTSDADFSITGLITVTSPNGGENYRTGSSQTITWTDNISEDVKIELFKGGVFNSTIVDPTTSDGSHSYTVPAVVDGSDYTIVITSTTTGTVTDVSDANFSIFNPVITITAPNGGEIWDIGASYDITWTDNIAENVKIELFKGGVLNTLIAGNETSDGTYNWTVPAITEASDYTVVITSLTNGSVTDVSDANFTIQTSGITVSSPNGGEVWEIGSTHDITWTDNIAENVKIELFKAGVFNTLIAGNETSDGTYSWIVPAVTQASDYTVVITSVSNGSITDVSDANFTLQTSAITVSSPNGGENWQSGIDHTITWTDNISEDVKIELYKGGVLNFTIAASTPSTGSYTWALPSGITAGSDYTVVITSVSNGSITDASDANFSIFDSEITLTFPNGGEVLEPGDTYQITWDPTVFTENVKIELYKAGVPIDTVLFPSANNDGSHNWEVWNFFVPDNDYRIRISKVGDDSIFDFSDADFTIATFSPVINITSPNGGEVWEAGSRQFITSNENIPEIPANKIKYELWKGGVLDTVLFDAEDPDGSKIWDIAIGTVPGNDYKVKLIYVNDPTVTSISDANFTISSFAPQITVNSPNGGESWLSGIQQTITWTDNIPNNEFVKIDLYKGGILETVLFDSTFADGSKLWTPSLSTTPGSDYKIRITSVDNATVLDSSDADFSISAPITVNSPNGGESWLTGSSQTITWIDNIAEDVKIELFKAGFFNSEITASMQIYLMYQMQTLQYLQIMFSSHHPTVVKIGDQVVRKQLPGRITYLKM
jgi:hypothetical protein